MKKAIVTGASGFIGSYLVKELVENNYEVLAIVRENTSNMNRLKDFSNIEIVNCNLDNLNIINETTNKTYDYFFHFAWDGVSGDMQTDYDLQVSNISNTLLALDVAKKLGCKRFIAAGSIQEIECTKEMAEEKEVSNQGNAYKISKMTAHYYSKLKASKVGIDFLWPLLTNTYGPGEVSSRLINTIIRKLIDGKEPALTKADQLYDFIYITDAARAYRYIAERGISYKNYIIGSGRAIPLKEYLLELKEIVNPNINLGFGKYEYNGIYLSKDDLSTVQLSKDTEFKTEISFTDGIQRTMKWINESIKSSSV